MRTTALFVEILVCGLQTTIWLALIVLSMFGYEWVKVVTTEKILALTIFIITISYPFGIIFDRFWGYLIQTPQNRIRNEFFESEEEFIRKRAKLFYESESSMKFFDYTRSRMRIARASFFNFILIIVTSSYFILTQSDSVDCLLKYELLWFTIICGVSLTLLSYYSWWRIQTTYYRQIYTIYDEIFGP